MIADFLPLLLIPLAIIMFGTIIYLEERYYARHPEKERPEPNPYP